MKKLFVVISLLEAALTLPARAADKDYPSYPYVNESPAQKDARLAWWRAAKFGMFIHWGLYAIPADGEWHMRKKTQTLAEYAKYAREFNPVKFDADEWMGLAHDAGMKYLVITARHHDGFAMFDSQASSYNIVAATPFKRDPLKELAAACPRHDIRFGVYYSHFANWGQPGGAAGCEHWDKPAQDGDFDAYVDQIAVPQLRELMSNYGPIAELWFDTDGAKNQPAASNRLFEEVKRQPGIIINPRAGCGDFDTYERRIPEQAPGGDWECCNTINGAWGYQDSPARPLKDLLPAMIDVWTKGGNMLLNVGPNRDGVIPASTAERLRQIGAWLKVNGEAIYGTRPGPFPYLSWGCTSQKGNMLYLHVLRWPKTGALALPTENKVVKAFLLADANRPLTVETRPGKTIIHLPPAAPDPVASVVALQLAGAPVPGFSLARNKPVKSSSNNAAWAVGDDPHRWASFKKSTTGNAASAGWMEVDLQAPAQIGVVRIIGDMNVQLAVKYRNRESDAWTLLFEAGPITSRDFIKVVPPVTAQYLRLEVTGFAARDYGLNSFQVYSPE